LVEIAHKVHRIPNVNGSNAVLIDDKKMALIDTGIAGNGEAIIAYIKDIGRKPEDLAWIIVTHFHYDHSGSANELSKLTGAKIVAHLDETLEASDGKKLLLKGNENTGTGPPWWYRTFFANRLVRSNRNKNGQTKQFDYIDTEIHYTVNHGDVIPVLGGLRILHAPGHTPGSICPVLEGTKMIFLGDSVLNNRIHLSRPLTWDKRKRKQLDVSLRSLRDEYVDHACFGHGPPLIDHAAASIKTLTDRPYNVPTWRIALKHQATLKRFRERSKGTGHWEGGIDPDQE
jgi:glyoxylase-like metal-dependent hydrolase (beta-lactamase superfamily II)